VVVFQAIGELIKLQYADFFSDTQDDGPSTVFGPRDEGEEASFDEMKDGVLEMCADADEGNVHTGFYCLLPPLADSTIPTFYASEKTSFNTLLNAIDPQFAHASFSRKPQLVFKLSTDLKDSPWEDLNSEANWEYAIRRVRNKTMQPGSGKRKAVNVEIAFSDMRSQEWVEG